MFSCSCPHLKKISPRETSVWILLVNVWLNATLNYFLLLPTTFWLNAKFWIFNVLYPSQILLSQYWLPEIYIHIQQSETSSIQFSAKDCFNNSLTVFIKVLWFKYVQFLCKTYETVSNRQTANSHSTTPSEKEIDDNNNPSENHTESFQCKVSVEPITNLTNNTQQNPLQIPDLFYSEILTEQIPNPSEELEQQNS